jgi:hypothetical protein
MFRWLELATALLAFPWLLPEPRGAAPQAALLPAAPAAVVAERIPSPKFHTEAAAQAHCPPPSDENVVWVNTALAIFYYKGDPYYGHTDYGVYACLKDARGAGDLSHYDES